MNLYRPRGKNVVGMFELLRVNSNCQPKTPHPRATQALTRGIKFPVSNKKRIIMKVTKLRTLPLTAPRSFMKSEILSGLETEIVGPCGLDPPLQNPAINETLRCSSGVFCLVERHCRRTGIHRHTHLRALDSEEQSRRIRCSGQRFLRLCGAIWQCRVPSVEGVGR